MPSQTPSGAKKEKKNYLPKTGAVLLQFVLQIKYLFETDFPIT